LICFLQPSQINSGGLVDCALFVCDDDEGGGDVTGGGGKSSCLVDLLVAFYKNR